MPDCVKANRQPPSFSANNVYPPPLATIHISNPFSVVITSSPTIAPSASSPFGKSSLSMSTNYVSMSDGEIWNVMLQRTTSSTNANITQSYQLYMGLQDSDKIKNFNCISMSGVSSSNVNFTVVIKNIDCNTIL